jgi:precorrin-6A/cobalt-precorrin-6A reductase
VTGKVLLLGGSSQASEIAIQFEGLNIPSIASLAGATRKPKPLAIETRIGGYGGADGLAQFILNEGITAVLDATHPFAKTITKTAHDVCKKMGVPHAIVQRPEWQVGEGDKWTFIETADQLATLLPEDANVFIGTGRKTLDDYEKISNRKLLVRVIDAPNFDFPYPNGHFVIGRPPFSVAHEIETFQREKIDWLIVKNAGGAASETKLTAARELGVSVALFNRPKLPERATVFQTVDDAVIWVQQTVKK